MAQTIWVTGATGFVGSHFVYRVLKTTDAELVAVARAKAGKAPKERMLEVLSSVAISYGEQLDVQAVSSRIHVVSGDIEQSNCGVELDQLPHALVRGDLQFWHIAACLSYEDRYAETIRSQNVGGTRNALQLAEMLGVERFVYVSTAYTCGRYEGAVPEELHSLDRVFNNVYEQSKAQAEHVVAEWSLETGRRAAILRPSVVVGPRRTYLPGGSTSGVYGFARETRRLKRMLEASKAQLSMLGEPEAPINVIPVDDLAQAMCERAEEDFAGGLVHHLTSDRVPTVGYLLAVVGKHCGNGPIELVRQRNQHPSPVEKVMDRRAQFYSNYLRAPKTFERRAGAPIHVSDRELEWFVEAYANECAGAAPALFARDWVTAADGSKICAYHCGAEQRPALVLINAYGLTCDIWAPLATMLNETFRVITWDLRMPTGEEALSPDDHAEDLLCLLEHFGVRAAHVAGYCTGADLAIRFASLYPERVDTVASLSGALNMVGASETSFQANMRKLALRASADLQHARLFHQLLFGQRRGHYGIVAASERSDEAMLSSMVTTPDPELLHLTSAPFRDPQSLHDYARAMQGHYSAAKDQSLSALRLPLLLLTGLQDDIVHPHASRIAAEVVGDAQCIELPEADHFAIYKEPGIVATLLRAHALQAQCAHEERAVA